MKLLSSDQAAQALGVSKTTLYAYVSRGMLESVEGPERTAAPCHALVASRRNFQETTRPRTLRSAEACGVVTPIPMRAG